MKLYLLYEDYSDLIAIAHEYKRMLIYVYNKWIAYNKTPLILNNIGLTLNKKVTKNNVKEMIMSMTIDQFNECFEDWLYIKEARTID